MTAEVRPMATTCTTQQKVYTMQALHKVSQEITFHMHRQLIEQWIVFGGQNISTMQARDAPRKFRLGGWAFRKSD